MCCGAQWEGLKLVAGSLGLIELTMWGVGRYLAPFSLFPNVRCSSSLPGRRLQAKNSIELGEVWNTEPRCRQTATAPTPVLRILTLTSPHL